MFVTYQVTGTSGDNAISISIVGNSIISAVDGVSDSASDIINNNIEINGLGGNDTISITETGNNTVVVNAGDGSDTINIAIGANDLDVIDGAVTVHGDNGSDVIALHDQNQASPGDYQMSNGDEFSRPGVATITADVEHATLNGGTGDWDASLNQRPDLDIVVKGSSGSNVLYLRGGLGSARYEPSALTGSGAIHFVENIFGVPEQFVSFSSFQQVYSENVSSITLDTGKRLDDIDVTASSASNTLSGTTGGVTIAPLVVVGADDLSLDLYDVDILGFGDVAHADVVTLSGGLVGAERINTYFGLQRDTLNVLSGTWVTDVTASADRFDLNVTGGANVTYESEAPINRLTVSNASRVTLELPPIGNPVVVKELFATGTGTNTVQVGSGHTVLTDGNGTFSIAAGAALVVSGPGELYINCAQSHGTGSILRADGNAVVNVQTDPGGATGLRRLALTAMGQSVVNLNASASHLASAFANTAAIKILPNGNRRLVTNSMGTDSHGYFDLFNNDLLFDYTTTSAANLVRSLLTLGRANGNWDGVGIRSTTAAEAVPHNVTLGLLEATEFKSLYGAGASFAGEPIDDTALLIKFTYYGDANFDGRVTFDDYTKIDTGFNQHRTGWLNGDFNFSGGVNFDDYVLIDTAFNSQGAVLAHFSTPTVKSPKQGSRQ